MKGAGRLTSKLRKRLCHWQPALLRVGRSRDQNCRRELVGVHLEAEVVLHQAGAEELGHPAACTPRSQ